MIRFLHEPGTAIVEYSTAAAFTGLVGLLVLVERIRRDKARDINRPNTFKREMYAEDDFEEIIVEGAAPIPVLPAPIAVFTPTRGAIALVFITLMIAGSWFALLNFRIMHCWDLGDAAKASGDFAFARAQYLKALGLDPMVPESHRKLAEALLKQNLPDQAILELQTAVTGDRGDYQVHLMLADALHSVDRLNEAVPEYQQAIAIAPRVSLLYVRLGSCLVKLNRIADAISEFQYAIKLDPKDVKAVSNLGCLLVAFGRVQDGLALLRRAVELAPYEVGVYNTLGTNYAAAKMYPQAVEAFRAELAVNPQYTVGYFNLGMALKQTGDTDAAEAAFTSYLKNSFSVSTPGEDAKAGVPAAFEELQKLHKLRKATAKAHGAK